MLPNAVQGARTLVLPWAWVLGHGDDWCEPSAAMPLTLCSCQAALWLQEVPRCPSQCPGSAGWPHLQPTGAGRGLGKVCEVLRALPGASRDKRRDSGLSPQMARGEPRVTAELTVSKALGKDVGEAVVVVRLWWAAEIISPSAATKVMSQTSSSKVLFIRMLSNPNSTLYFFTTCMSSRYSHSTSHRTFL